MIKKDLLAMPKLRATPYMMQLAHSDKLTKECYGYYTKMTYKRNVYIRCLVKKGILKMAFYFTDNMRMGGTLPAFEVYVDRDNKQYLTYDYRKEKWLTASIYRLNLPTYDFLNRVWYARETKKALHKYFNNDKDAIDALHSFQTGVLSKKLETKHKKETDPWDEDLKQTPDLPKDWKSWVSKIGIPEHYIFYQYSRKKKGQTGYCTHCEKEVPIKEPRHNKDGKCSRCGVPITYKALGRCGTVITGNYIAHLIQRCKDGVILREFRVSRKHHVNHHKEPEVYASEVRRIICDKNGFPKRAYYFGCYKRTNFRWIAGTLTSVSRGYFYYYWSYEGKVYGKTLPSLLKNELKKTGFMEYYRCKGTVDPERFLRGIETYPYLEKVAKVGLITLFDQILQYGSSDYDGLKINETANSLLHNLCIDAGQLKRLKAKEGGRDVLRWLQFEKAHCQAISDETLVWLCQNDLKPKKFDFITDKMNIEQIRRYILRKIKDENMWLDEVITTWSDYLSMAKRLKLDINNEKVYKVHRLRLRHNELVAIINKEELSIRAGEIRELYPNAENNMAAVKSKYEFPDKDYTVLAPTTVEEILTEGKLLNHCVSNDKYWERITSNESYVFFLRKTKEVDVAYYTLEVEPCGTIRQKRTFGDVQNDDIEDATKFLQKWQKIISSRMNEDDRKLAEKSKILRLQEFADMDKGNILIRTGHLQGHRLVDVLMADLMEAA